MSATTDDAGLLARLRASTERLRAAEFEVARDAAAIDASDLPATSRYRSGHKMVGDVARVDPATAKRWIAHGRAMTEGVSLGGQPTEPAWPATGKAAEAGALGADHVKVIARAMDAVGRVRGLDPDAVAAAESHLAEAATRLAPSALEKVVVRLQAHLDPDGVAPLDPPQDSDELHLRTSRRDGSLSFSGRVHAASDVELLRETFDALSTPAGPDDQRPIAQRRVEALLELAERAAAAGGLAADDPENPDTEDAGEPVGGGASPTRPGPARGRPLLVITIDHRDLQKTIGHGLLDSDRTIAASEARRLGCDAGVLPVLLGSAGQPLDVGRMSYTVPEGMRRALHQRDRGCAFPGCDRRPRRCQAHHVRHWADHGVTALDNLALLCRFHHQLVHAGDWEIRMREGRPWFTPPAWIDPTRTPRPGGPHPLGP